MIAEILLSGVLLTAAGTFGYLYYDHRRGVLAREAEQQGRDEQRRRDALASEAREQEKAAQLRREQRERDEGFLDVLIRHLRRHGAPGFSLSAFAVEARVSRTAADRAAIEIYTRAAQEAVAGVVITPNERELLDNLVLALEIDRNRADEIERQARADLYRGAVSDVLADGVVTADETARLEGLRRSLGLSRQEGLRLAEGLSRDSYLALLRRVVQAGGPTAEDRAELQRYKQTLLSSDPGSDAAIRTGAIELYRECFTGVIQDGEVTEADEQLLGWIQEEAGLHDVHVAPYHTELQTAKRLAAYRRGELPGRPTTKLLEGGETCHWEGHCTFRYQTATKHMQAAGELIVTSKRILLTSPTKTVSFTPSKVLDIILYSDGLEIKTDARSGMGTYIVGEPRELEAILCGLVRKHKFRLAENYDSAKTRHIPDDVKRAVWDRDGGRCVRCGATDYLEYDHIIPHAKGGANSVANVQVLCRRCNLHKSDRI